MFSKRLTPLVLLSLILVPILIVAALKYQKETDGTVETVPTVRVSFNNYKSLGYLGWEWKELSSKNGSWAYENVAFFIENVTAKAEALGLNSTEINQILHGFVSNYLIMHNTVLIPCRVEKAYYDSIPAWIIVFNRGSLRDQSAFIGHFNIFAVECKTQKILGSAQCR